MKLDGRRESSNVEDRRGKSGISKAGIGGIGGIIIAAIVTLLMGGNLGDVISGIDTSQLGQITEQTTEGREFTAEEQKLAQFSKQILASTEDVWSKLFEKMGKTYTPPKMVLYDNSTPSGCGQGKSSMGPFYCSADQTLYIDLTFFSSMKKQLGADGDFAYAYVIAHEVGHHVEYLLGSLTKAHQKMSRLSESEANKESVRLELLADFYAGVWGHHENGNFGSLEDGDLEEAINCSHQIGDDYLEKQAQGYAVPETFTHGTSAQRMKWLKLGLTTGDMSQGRTFEVDYNDL